MFDHGLDSPNKASSHLQHSNLHLPNMDLYLLLELLLLLHILLLLRVHGPATEEEEQEEEEEEERGRRISVLVQSIVHASTAYLISCKHCLSHFM